jgi:transposase, IS6 family
MRQDQAFEGRQFNAEVILLDGAVVSDVPDQQPQSRAHAAGPGVEADHITIFRWIQAYAAELKKRIRIFG